MVGDERAIAGGNAPGAELTTWRQVVALVEREFEVVARGEDWLGTIHRDATGTMGVKVKIRPTMVLGRGHVAIIAEVFSASVLPPAMLLAINNRMGVGSLEEEGGMILLRSATPIPGLTAAFLRGLIAALGNQASFMQRKAVDAPKDPDAFTHYTE